MDGLWPTSAMEHDRGYELLNLDNIKEETIIKIELENDLFECERRLVTKNELLNLDNIKEVTATKREGESRLSSEVFEDNLKECTINQRTGNIFYGRIELTDGTWCFSDREANKQNELLNIIYIKEESTVNQEEDNSFEVPYLNTRTEENKIEYETYEQRFIQSSQSTQEIADIVIGTHNQNPSNKTALARMNNKDALRKARQQRYREKHRDEINKRSRDRRRNKEISQNEYDRIYWERHKGKINQLRKERRLLHLFATEQITGTTSSDQVDIKDALRRARQQRYREKHREEINKRNRDRRRNKDSSQSLHKDFTRNERNKVYWERHREKVNQQRKEHRPLEQNEQRIETGTLNYN